MKALSCLAIAGAIAGYALSSAKAQDDIRLVSIKGGETLQVGVVTLVTSTCDPLFLSFEGIDILEAPPELSLKLEPGIVRTFTTTRDCPKPVNGGTIMATAKDVTVPKEGKLTIRVRMKTKQGRSQRTYR
jgi:hypothetical protein